MFLIILIININFRLIYLCIIYQNIQSKMNYLFWLWYLTISSLEPLVLKSIFIPHREHNKILILSIINYVFVNFPITGVDSSWPRYYIVVLN